MGSFARKRARFSRKAEEKAYLKEQQYNNQLYGNINSVAEILKRCEPMQHWLSAIVRMSSRGRRLRL